MSTAFQLQRIINLLNHLRSNQNFIIDTMLNDERQYEDLEDICLLHQHFTHTHQ